MDKALEQSIAQENAAISHDVDYWDILKKTSRTFYLSIRKLPGIIKETTCLSYLLLRVSDFFEDNEYMQPEEKVRWLNLWLDILNGQAPSETWKSSLMPWIETDGEAFAAYYGPELYAAFLKLPEILINKIIGHVQATTQGMARWTAKGPKFVTEEDMDDYMFEVAGRVGYTSTEVFAWYSKGIRKHLVELIPLARETGLALQTVNILRGLRKDYERGWIYVPESFTRAAGLTKREDLFDPAYQDNAMKVVDMLIEKSERHLASALAYVKLLPKTQRNIRLAAIWPMMFAVRTVAISRNNYGVITGEVKLAREEIKSIIKKTSLLGWSNLFIEYYFNKLSKPLESSPA
jgi:farnesyl-diphosphate farnesyltransferase